VHNFDDRDQIDLTEVSDRAQVSARTIRYYIQQGLIPAPETRGPGAHYGPAHVDRLRLIKLLQRQHLPLSEIRRRIESLSPQDIRRILDGDAERPPSSASEYVQRVLVDGLGPVRTAEPAYAFFEEKAPNRGGSLVRSQWERFALAADVELHVRRPVSREDNRRIERLLDAARDIFKEDLS